MHRKYIYLEQMWAINAGWSGSSMTPPGEMFSEHEPNVGFMKQLFYFVFLNFSVHLTESYHTHLSSLIRYEFLKLNSQFFI